MAPNDRSPSDDPGPFDAAWLAGRRWFRSKARPLTSVALDDLARLPGGGELLVLSANFADGGSERYLVPAVAGGGARREPRDGDGVWRALGAAIAAGETLAGKRGAFRFEGGPALDRLLPGGAGAMAGLDERPLGVEQSNTSVQLGERLLLKVYRLLEGGTNPEVEILEFLTERGFANIPLAAGSVTYLDGGAEPAAAAILTSFVAAEGDAWAWFGARLANPAGHGEATAAAGEIGRLTAAMHRSLQSEPDREGFPSRQATGEEIAAWRASAHAQLSEALRMTGGEARVRLDEVAAGVRSAFDAILGAREARVARIHGDHHLGQLLVTGGGFVITDFEGEPARPLAERRLPASPLRDVAGMLRSFDYAARAAERGADGQSLDGWLAGARDAFLAAYRTPAGAEALLHALELEKACYEVRYEASFRPAWVEIPLGAIERLVAGR